MARWLDENDKGEAFTSLMRRALVIEYCKDIPWTFIQLGNGTKSDFLGYGILTSNAFCGKILVAYHESFLGRVGHTLPGAIPMRIPGATLS